MGSNDSTNSVPKWAEFFTKDEYDEFTEHISTYFLCKGLSFKIGDGLVEVGENEFGYGKNGLDNIARMCKVLPRSEWQYRINFHFGALEKTFLFQKEVEIEKDFYEEMKQYISVRIFSNAYMHQVGEAFFVKKQIADDLVMALVFDYPDSIQNMKMADIKNWNKDLDELLEVGKRNAKNNNKIIAQYIEMDDYSLYAVETHHYYAANIYFELDELDFLEKNKGCLIAFPTRSCTIIYPIKNMEVVKVLNKIIPVVYNMYNDGAGPLSHNVYWYVSGFLKRIPYTFSETSITITPCAEFVQLLNTVAEK